MSEILKKYSQLSEIKQQACRLKAEGETLEVISAETGTPLPTVESWVLPSGLHAECVAEYKLFLAEKQVESTEEFQKRIVGDAVALWERLKSRALSDDLTIPEHVKQAALDSALDRIIPRISKTEGKHAFTFTDNDRAKRFKEIAELQADIEPLQLKRLAGGKTD